MAARKNSAMEPLETDDLIDRAYASIREQLIREQPDFLALRCSWRERMYLRMVDYIVRQRLVEHIEREPHYARTGRPKKAKSDDA